MQVSDRKSPYCICHSTIKVVGRNVIFFNVSGDNQESLISTSEDNLDSATTKHSTPGEELGRLNGASTLNQVQIIPKWQIKEDRRGRNRNGQKRKLDSPGSNSAAGLDLYQKKILGLDSMTSGNATLDPRCKKRKRATLLTKDGPVDVSHLSHSS